MKKKYCIMGALIGIMFFFNIHIAYGKEEIVSKLNLNEAQYTVKFTNAKAMISRDGSEAISITSGTKLTKPGTYFLTLLDAEGGVKVNTFTLQGGKDTNSWTINRESELEEILKYSLENFKKEIVIKFNYGEFSIDELSELFEKRINVVLDKYPKLVYEGHGVLSVLGKAPTVRVKLSYPLQVTNTLKTYDVKTEKMIIQIINENITPNMQDYKREIALFKYIIDNITYSMTKGKAVNYINATPMTHTMYGGLINKSAVCDGYAKSLMYLLNAVGVPAKFVVGNISDGGELHAWNIVKIQGNYYHVDSTWGDQEEEQVGAVYDFFNEKDSYMRETHMWDTNLYPKAVTETYNMLYMPMQLQGIYRVMKPENINEVLSEIAKAKSKTATVIFYEDSLNKWDDEVLSDRIVSSLGKNIMYSAQHKYNCLIISFKTN